MWGLVSLCLVVAACSGKDDEGRPGRDAGPGDALMDAASDVPPNQDSARPDAMPSLDAALDAPGRDNCDPSCGDMEICGSTNEGNGFDDDCDNMVDEGCVCPAYNVTRPCFNGPPDKAGVGTCANGVMACGEFLSWGPCTGGSVPRDEVCDNADNDCDGEVDNGVPGCSTTLRCPGTEDARPLRLHELRGSDIYRDGMSYHWEITCPDSVASCPGPDDPNAKDTVIYLVQSGAYEAHVEIRTAGGDTLECSWIINVGGTGLRVELQWDTQGEGHGDTDVDLHLHRQTTGAGMSDSEWTSGDDCYYGNCKASDYEVDWGLIDTAETEACSSAPHGHGNEWATRGSCANPRLDVDVISCNPAVTEPTRTDFCSPENINVDNPGLGVPYRIMVHYFSTNEFRGETNPSVNVFCNGEQRGRFVPPRAFRDSSDHWLVGDVVFQSSACGLEPECRIVPIDMVQSGSAFGPPWSF